MPFKSEAQRRWMFAAEERGEVPKGTARRWAKETKGKDLPEHVSDKKKKGKRMKKEAMFFSDRELVEDGEFMKCAQKYDIPEVDKKPKMKRLPTQQKMPEFQAVQPGEQTKGIKAPSAPKPAPAKDLLKTSQMMGIPGGTGMGMSGVDASADSAMMGAGSKAKKKKTTPMMGCGMLHKKGELTTERLGKTVSRVGAGAKKGVEQTLESIEGLPPWAHAAMAGGVGLYGLSKLKKGVKALARGGRASRAGSIAKMIRRLRGR